MKFVMFLALIVSVPATFGHDAIDTRLLNTRMLHSHRHHHRNNRFITFFFYVLQGIALRMNLNVLV